MRLYNLGLLLLSVASLASAESTTKPKPVPTGCHAKGVSMYTLYGSKEDVQRALAKLPSEFGANRMRLMLLETKESASLALYERADSGSFTLAQWDGASSGRLRVSLDEMILKTRGSDCAGEVMKQMIGAQGIGLRPGQVATPATLQAAFSPMIEEKARGYVRVTLLDPCEPVTPPPPPPPPTSTDTIR
jgi:hypothetical protein